MVDGLEIVWIDDGSTDSTWRKISELAAGDSRVRGLSFSRNFGHQTAVTAGVDAARGRAVVIIDADLQDPPEVIPEMVEKWREGYEVVFGQRTQRDGETIFKRFTSAAFYRTLRSLAHIEIPLDTGDFRLMGPKALEAFRAMPEHNRFVRGMVSWIGFPQTAVRFPSQTARQGRDQVPTQDHAQVGPERVHFVQLCSPPDGDMAGTRIGRLSRCLSRASCGVWRWSERSPSVRRGLVATIFFLAGVQLLAIGALGEYVARVFEEADRRPLYLIKEHTDGATAVFPR